MKNRSFLLLPVFLSFLFCSFSLKAQLDSLLLLAHTAEDGQVKIDAYKDLAFANYNQHPELSLRYCDTLELVAERAGLPRQAVKAAYLRAVVWWTRGENERAVAHCERGLAILREPQNEDERANISTINNLLGSIYINQGLFEEGAEVLMEAARQSLMNQDSQGYAYSLINVATALDKHGDDVSAREHTLRSIEVLKALGENANLVTAYNNLASYTNDPMECIGYLAEAERYGEISGNHFQLIHTYHNYVRPLTEMERFPEALAYERRAYHLAREYDNIQLKIATAIGLGQVMDRVGRQDSAIYLLREGIGLAEATGMTSTIQTGYYDLAELFRGQGQMDSAYFYLERQLHLQDSLHQRNVTERMAVNNARFGVVERDQQIAEQQLELALQQGKRNRILFGGMALLLLLGSIAYGLFHRQRQRKAAVEIALATEARETARLRELDVMKSQFFTNVSHELRTPLTLITSPLAEALEKLKQTNLKPNLELAHRNSHQLLGLVNEMLDLAKLETGNVTPEISTQAFEPWLRRVFYSFQSAAEGKNLNWDFNLSPSPVTKVETDFPKLEKILNNLLSNALKFTPAGGRVALSGSCGEGQLTLQVTDDGPGIPPKELPRIFDRFYQSAHLPATGGTGIGLALSRRLARLLGGDLTATSKLGEGSRFELVVPVTTTSSGLIVPEDDVPGVEEKTVIPPPPPGLSGVRPRLLIVEDHPEMSLYLRQSLVQEYDSVIAGNGAAALELMGKQNFDLILSDVMMPVMDGFALRQKINEVPEWAGTPFIFLTARTLEADKLRGFQLGIDDYVTKPFQLAELKARMNSLLINKTRREEHALTQDTGVDDEQQLLGRAEQLVRERLDDLTFTVEEMARELGYSQRQLSRVFGRMAGLTPVQFVLEVRLQHARHLLETGQHGTVAEVRYAIGIESASYFTRKFKERFGRNPRTYFSS